MPTSDDAAPTSADSPFPLATVFPQATVEAILAHMNVDHTGDNLLIARAFGPSNATSAVMTGLDGRAGRWSCETPDGPRELTVPWSVAISERAEIRREVVMLYDSACARLGVEARPHA